MSRSHHVTRRERERLQREDFRDPAEKRRRLAAVDDALDGKRLAKRLARPARVAAAAAVPVWVRHAGPHVVHGASPEDLRAVMARLPAGTLDGLRQVTLEHRQWPRGERAPDPDPLTGRPGWERLPGVWCGGVLGTYFPDERRIALYSHTVAPGLGERWALLLRLWTLATFAHEVAHHEDHVTNEGRARPVSASEKRRERFAEHGAARWVRSVVVPYLEAAYADEVERLQAWLEHHGGTRLPPALLASNWRFDEGGRPVPVYLGCAAEAVDGLARDVLRRRPPLRTRVGFAESLHFGANYAEAHAALDSAVALDPTDREARRLRADIFVHERRCAEAEPIVAALLAEAPRDLETRLVAVDLAFARGDWTACVEAATAGLALARLDRNMTMTFLNRRAHAYERAGRLAEMHRDLDVRVAAGSRFVPPWARPYREA